MNKNGFESQRSMLNLAIWTTVKYIHLQIYLTRLLGRFALIFYFNCEHVLFVYILKQKQNKKFRWFYQENN